MTCSSSAAAWSARAWRSPWKACRWTWPLVEATPPGDLPAVFDQRNLSLAAASVNALDVLGVMRELRAPTGAIRRIHVSRAGDFGSVRLQAADYGREAFGKVVVARDFGEALEARLSQLPRLTRYRPARCVALEGDDRQVRGVCLAVAGGELALRARLLVAADGTRSVLRDALGIASRSHDYGQTLFVARVRGDRAPDGSGQSASPTAAPLRCCRAAIAASAWSMACRPRMRPPSPRWTRPVGWRGSSRPSAGAPGAFSVPANAAPIRSPGSSPKRWSRHARCFWATPRRPSIRSARRVSTSACAMR